MKKALKLIFGGVVALVLLVVVLLVVDISNDDKTEEVVNKTETETANKEKDKEKTEPVNEEKKETNTDSGTSTVAALESNDFIKFTEEYKKLGEEKTPVWDNQLNGKVVTWTGTVVRAGTSQLFVYGGNDYNGETWDELGEANKLYQSFVAKYAEGTADQFKQLQTGDKVTVEGSLESRGDFDLNFNWKLYDSVIK